MNLVPLRKQRRKLGGVLQHREPLCYLFTHQAGADRQLNLEDLASHSDSFVAQ